MPALSLRSLGLIAEMIPATDGVLLVGERAVAFWVAVFGVQNESSQLFRSHFEDDVFRLLGPPRAALALGQASGGFVRIAAVEDESSQITALVSASTNGQKWSVEFQSGVRGFSREQLEKARHSALPVVQTRGRRLPLAVLHPVHCLREQLEDTYGYPLGRRREPNGEHRVVHVDLAIEACRRITLRHLKEDDVPRAVRIVEAVHEISLLPAALRARVTDGVRVENAIVESDVFPKEFRRKRLRHFRRVHERKVSVYRRRFSHLTVVSSDAISQLSVPTGAT